MTRGVLSLADLWVQVALALVMHWIVGDHWSATEVLARVGGAVMVGLTLLATWRVCTGSMGWVTK